MSKHSLHVAVIQGNAKKVAELLQKGVSPDLVWKGSYTPLHLAADENRTDVTNLLIGAGANIHAKSKDFGETALHIAAYRGATEIVAMLLAHGAKVTQVDGRKRTPLHYAASGYEGTLTAAETLLRAGAKIDAKDEDRESPLGLAALSQNLGVVYLLVKAGASLKHMNIYGQAPVDIARIQLQAYVTKSGYVPPKFKVNASIVRDIIRLTSRHKRFR